MSQGPFGQSSAPPRAMTIHRKITFFALGALVLDILIGAGFSNMSASSAPTPAELDVIRVVAVICLAIAGAAWVMGQRVRGRAED